MIGFYSYKKPRISNGVKGIFIAGTDTGVGKTTVCGFLARYFLNKGCKVITQKWIETGGLSFSSDINTHLKLMKTEKTKFKPYLSLACPYILKFPASAHLAARKEKLNIQAGKIKKSFKALTKEFDLVIVEGIGGSLVPFNNEKLVIDIAKELKLPVLIVAANKLGAINHTLLTIEALRRRKMKIIGIVFNNILPKTNPLILKDNPQIVKTLSREKVLGDLPFLKDKNRLYKKFISIGEKIRF